MEFAHLGAHCAVEDCKQHDFLPFQCDLCEQQYCLAHRTYEAHGCANAHLAERKFAPTCPLCGQVLLLSDEQRNTVDINQLVDAHIQQGCPPVPKSTVSVPQGPRCARASCKQKAITMCKLCGSHFCVDHRIETDHECIDKKKKPKQPPKSVAQPMKSTKKLANQQLGALHRERIAQKQQVAQASKSALLAADSVTPPVSKSLTTPTPTKSNVMYQRQAKVMDKQFANRKQDAIGQSSIEDEDRFYLDVYFPLGSKVKPLHMYFSRNWKIGKVMDKIAQQGKIMNYNSTELDPSKRLNLFNVITFERLPSQEDLKEVPSLIQNRGAVILEFGEQLAPETKNVIETTLKSTTLPFEVESLCVIS